MSDAQPPIATQETLAAAADLPVPKNDFCRSWIEIAKILLHPDAGKLGNGACKLDSCRTAADNDEGEQSPPLHLARGHLGMFEGFQRPTADKSCVFHALEAGAKGAQSSLPK